MHDNSKAFLKEAGYAQPKDLMRRYSIGRTTVYKLTKAMESTRGYPNSVIHLSSKMTLINLKDFERYIISRNNMYLKE